MAKSRPDHPQPVSANHDLFEEASPTRATGHCSSRQNRKPIHAWRMRSGPWTSFRRRGVSQVRAQAISMATPSPTPPPTGRGRFSAGLPGVLYVGDSFEVALAETVFHHAIFMAKTNEQPGWTSQFREIVLTVRSAPPRSGSGAPRNPSKYLRRPGARSETARRRARTASSYHASVRWPEGECVGLFYPNCARNVLQGRHLDYHWDGQRVDLYRDLKLNETHQVFRIIDED